MISLLRVPPLSASSMTCSTTRISTQVEMRSQSCFKTLHYTPSSFYTGSFELDLSWKQLVGNLGQNLKWVELLASKKNINCEVINETGCTAFLLSAHSSGMTTAAFCCNKTCGILFSSDPYLGLHRPRVGR